MASLLRKLLLAAALVGALLARRQLADAAQAQRLDSTQVEELVPNEERKDLLVAMVTLVRGDGATFEYLRSQGQWRCRQAFGALGDPGEVQQLVDAVLLAEGTVHSDVPERAVDYGFDGEAMWTVRFHGTQALADPDGDVLLEVELGRALPALDGAFVRRPPGSPRVLAIDTDPRALLDASGAAPPLLDEKVLPVGWPGAGARIERLELSRAEDAFLLSLAERELSEAERSMGASPVSWTLGRPDGSQAETSPDHAIAYTVFLRLASWYGVVDPARLKELVEDRLAARLVLVPSRGEPVVLLFGAALEDGRVPMVQGQTRMLYLLEQEVARLMLPESDQLLEAGGANPWEPWLARAAQPLLPR